MKLLPAFQPILNVQKQRFSAAEVLARWQMPDGQLVGPYQKPDEPDWIRTDLELAKQIRASADACRAFFPFVFINVSEETLASEIAFKNWFGIINDIARNRGMKIVVEVVETVSEAVLQKRWGQLQSLGVAIALDDYGDGRSTFTRLTARKWDFCKFSAKRLSGSDGILAVEFCQENGITGVAEQVENGALSLITQGLGLVHQQGYFHSRPALLTDHLEAVKKNVNAGFLKVRGCNDSDTKNPTGTGR